MGENQPLPVPPQAVLAASGSEAQSGTGLPRLQQQPHLRIVAQRLIMSHALRGRGDGLLVDDVAGAEIRLQPEPLGDDPPQDLQLHLPHEPDMQLLQAFVPEDMELGVLLLQGAELVQYHMGVGSLRQKQLVIQYRFQLRGGARGLAAQPLPGVGPAQAGDGADRPRLRGV